MLSFELSINIVALLALIIVSILAGFAFRRWKTLKIRARLYRVENEVIRSHAEILELQKQCLFAEQRLHGMGSSVVVMNSPPLTRSDKKIPNAALRKKLLTNVLTPAHVKAIS